MTYQTTLSFLALPAILTFTSLSFAQAECASDDECDAGETCEFGMSTSGCNPDAGPCSNDIIVDEVGECVSTPDECESDSDCGEYLSCETYDEDLTCWASSDGSMGCEEPDPDAPMYCEPAFDSCMADSDCPRDFECEVETECAAIACIDLEGAECPEPTCEPSGGECVPKMIGCDSDSACPSDWSCVEFVEEECSGTDGDGDGDWGGEPDSEWESGELIAPEPAGDPGAAPEVPQPSPEPIIIDCEETVTNYCIPDAWEPFYDDELGGTESGGEATSNDATDEVSSEADPEDGDDSSSGNVDQGGGCSVGQGNSGSGGWLWMLLMSAPMFIRRRRSA